MLSFHTLLTDLASDIGVDAVELIRTQELIVDDQVIGLYLAGENDDMDSLDGRPVADDVPGPDSEHATYVVFFTLLGAVDSARQPLILRTLLEANNLWAGTAGCTLGMQAGSGQIILCAQLPLAFLTGPDLSAVLASFAETATFWRSFVNGAALVEHESARALPFMLA